VLYALSVLYKRGFPKTSVFGKATLDLYGKAGPGPLFQESFSKPTGFWERLKFYLFCYDKKRLQNRGTGVIIAKEEKAWR
jgi:hypothetical protein